MRLCCMLVEYLYIHIRIAIHIHINMSVQLNAYLHARIEWFYVFYANDEVTQKENGLWLRCTRIFPFGLENGERDILESERNSNSRA